MTKFVSCTQAGVTGIMTANHYESYVKWRTRVDSAAAQSRVRRTPPRIPQSIRIFTFSNQGDVSGWMTGSLAVMRALIEDHDVVEGEFRVPFAEGRQHGDSRDAQAEQLFRTTLIEAISAFGLATAAELNRVRNEAFEQGRKTALTQSDTTAGARRR